MFVHIWKKKIIIELRNNYVLKACVFDNTQVSSMIKMAYCVTGGPMLQKRHSERGRAASRTSTHSMSYLDIT